MNTKLINILRVCRYLPHTVFFNLKFLPFKQAIKLPILLYKPKFINNTGKYIIIGNAKYGMIKLGFPMVSIFPNTGIVLENRGTVEFNGKCRIGNDSAISVGKNGFVKIGTDFVNTAGLKLVCYHKVIIGEVVTTGWNIVVMDTDFHAMKIVGSENKSKGYGSIVIGDHTWIASFSKVYKNSAIPSWCTVASNTIINTKIEAQPYSVIYNPSTVKSKYIVRYLDPYDDEISYE